MICGPINLAQYYRTRPTKPTKKNDLYSRSNWRLEINQENHSSSLQPTWELQPEARKPTWGPIAITVDRSSTGLPPLLIKQTSAILHFALRTNYISLHHANLSVKVFVPFCRFFLLKGRTSLVNPRCHVADLR